MKPHLFIVSSPAMGCGKSTVAKYLAATHRCVLEKMAGPLKAMLRCLLYHHPEVKFKDVDRMIEGDLKEQPCDALMGKTPRWAMQTLGTEWGRNQIGEDLWVRLAVARIQDHLCNGQSVVVDDVRFPNEVSALKMLPFRSTLCRVVRPGTKVTSEHSSEGALSGMTEWYIDNSGSFAYLQAEVDAMVRARHTRLHEPLVN